jgi:hypothetical protein
LVRLADWPRNPYLNDELREWVALHLSTLGVEDIAIYAQAAAGQDEERRVLVASSVGLLDSWYAPRGSTARFSLSVRLYPWHAVHGVDLRGETSRLWAHEHSSRWRLRLSRPALDTMADTPELGQALAEFAAACSLMAEPSSSMPAASPEVEDAVPAFLGRATKAEPPRAPIAVDNGSTPTPAPSMPTPAPQPAATPVASTPPATATVPATRTAPTQSPRQAEETVMDLERRLGLRGPES